jgi:hypothetical protein
MRSRCSDSISPRLDVRERVVKRERQFVWYVNEGRQGCNLPVAVDSKQSQRFDHHSERVSGVWIG